MEKEVILKWLMIVGGIVEVFLGPLIMLMPSYLDSLGYSSVPIFTQMAGAFVLGYGILLINASKDVEKNVIIPLINILIRIIVVILTQFSLSSFPMFLEVFIFAAIYDISWSIVVLILLIKSGYILKKK